MEEYITHFLQQIYRLYFDCVRFEVFTAVIMKNGVFSHGVTSQKTRFFIFGLFAICTNGPCRLFNSALSITRGLQNYFLGYAMIMCPLISMGETVTVNIQLCGTYGKWDTLVK
jgi:hypothetical protein